MKICLVSREYPPDTAWGGIGTYTDHLAHGLADAGHQVHVVAQGFHQNQEVADGSVTVHRIYHVPPVSNPIPPIKAWVERLSYSGAVNRRLQQLVKRHAIDIIEVPNFSGEGLVYSWHRRTPLVTRLHTHFSEVIQMCGWRRTVDHTLCCALEDAAVLRSDLVTCSSNAHREVMAHEVGMDPERIERIPLGVPLPPLNHRSPVRELPDPSVLFVGRLEQRKGAHVLLKAIPQVLREIPQTHFFLIGRDTYNDGVSTTLEGEAQHSFKAALLHDFPQEHLPRVHFLGYVEPELLARYYRTCDVFVAPSLYESFGFIYLEAMSYGKPVIGCSVGGVPEVVEDGVTGYLVPPEDPTQLTLAVLRLLKDSHLRRELGAQARRHVEAHFTRERMTEGTVRAYRKLI